MNDSIFETNPALFLFADSMFQHVDAKEFTLRDVEKNLEKMNSFRAKLCELATGSTLDETNQYFVTDSIASLLTYSINNPSTEDLSTHGMIFTNWALKDVLIFRLFNELSELLNNCRSENQRDLILTSFKNWTELEDVFRPLYNNLILLEFWEGSIGGPICIAGQIDIVEAEVNLLKNENAILLDKYPVPDNGTYLEPARQLLLSCIDISIEDVVSLYEEDDDDGESEEPIATATINEIKTLSQKLPSALDKWLESRVAWTEEISPYGTRAFLKRNTGAALLKYASLFSGFH
ncbi:MAG: hypothetical protein J1E63_07970 [Muribaculaceae bacterium]|nr:hypothetical protein [Muribaculaceae bacterium]